MNNWLEQHRTLIFAAVGLLIAAGIATFALRWQQPEPIVIEPPAPTATQGPIRVYVSGAVASPDVYTVPPNAILRDVLNSAGGTSADADLSALNLAAVLEDGDHVHVPRIGESPTSAPISQSGSDTGGALPVAGGLININTASQADLESLPGIGPAIAGRIIAYREDNGPFPNIEAVQNVSGIGPAIFDQIKALITVD
jgi:competence protein ComEA